MKDIADYREKCNYYSIYFHLIEQLAPMVQIPLFYLFIAK